MEIDKLLVISCGPAAGKNEIFDNPAPPQDPPSIRDLELAQECYDMQLHMQDPCPRCGGFRMQLGDWVCWGACHVCANVQSY